MRKPIDTAAIRSAIAHALTDAATLAFLEDHGGSARWLRDGLAHCERMDALSEAETDLRAWLRAFRRVTRTALASRPDLAQALHSPARSASMTSPEPHKATATGTDLRLTTVSKLGDSDDIPNARPDSAEADSNTPLTG